LRRNVPIHNWLTVLKNKEIIPMKHCLFWNWQSLLFVLIGSLIATVAGSPGPGYLALVGPAAFRFAPVARPCTNRFVLPAPVPVPVPAPVPLQIEKAPTPPLPAPAPAVTNQGAASDATQPPVGSAPADGVVSPQMLLRFFNKSTNNPASVIAPLDFTPPKAAVAAPSSATYSTGP
jgi:hypothetical protein